MSFLRFKDTEYTLCVRVFFINRTAMYVLSIFQDLTCSCSKANFFMEKYCSLIKSQITDRRMSLSLVTTRVHVHTRRSHSSTF